MKLTPKLDQFMYSTNPATPVDFRTTVELTSIEYYDNITTFPFSNFFKYSSPIFAQRKFSEKLRILIDLRQNNHLLLYKDKNNNFPMPTMENATTHLAGGSNYAIIDCCQAYFLMPMANELSMQFLTFIFDGITFAFKRLAQGKVAHEQLLVLM